MSPHRKRVIFSAMALIPLTVFVLEFLRALRFDHGAVRVTRMAESGMAGGMILVMIIAVLFTKGDED